MRMTVELAGAWGRCEKQAQMTEARTIFEHDGADGVALGALRSMFCDVRGRANAAKGREGELVVLCD